jgi:hypothetical protein
MELILKLNTLLELRRAWVGLKLLELSTNAEKYLRKRGRGSLDPAFVGYKYPNSALGSTDIWMEDGLAGSANNISVGTRISRGSLSTSPKTTPARGTPNLLTKERPPLGSRY